MVDITKRRGQKIEELYSQNNVLKNKKEGTSATLPFFLQSIQALSKHISFDNKTKKILEEVSRFHRLRIPLFYLNLMDRENPLCPIRQQAVPSVMEMEENGQKDPLAEINYSITPALIKRHPNRAVFLVTSQCAMYCRFCNRKRIVGKGWKPEKYREESLRRIEEDTGVKEIIMSGGDPFMLSPLGIGAILSRLRSMAHIETVRISTRMPVVFPMGVTEAHLRAMKKYAPLWVVIHINHPREISPEFLEVIRKIRESGNMVISQTVLLRNINDCPFVLSKLFHMLVAAGIKPYYLFQLDEAQGVSHFKVRLERGVDIMKTLRKNASGLAIPQYALDIPGGLGKVPLDYVYVKGRNGKNVIIESPSGAVGAYPNDGKKSVCTHCGICRDENKNQKASTK